MCSCRTLLIPEMVQGCCTCVLLHFPLDIISMHTLLLLKYTGALIFTNEGQTWNYNITYTTQPVKLSIHANNIQVNSNWYILQQSMSNYLLSFGRYRTSGHLDNIHKSRGSTNHGHPQTNTVYGHISREEAVDIWLMTCGLLHMYIQSWRERRLLS